MWGVLVQLYPRNDEEPPLRLHSEIFINQFVAQDYIDNARRANLPFKKTWIIQFEDPRNAS